MRLLFSIVAAITSVLVNGVFVAAEFAIVGVRRTAWKNWQAKERKRQARDRRR